MDSRHARCAFPWDDTLTKPQIQQILGFIAPMGFSFALRLLGGTLNMLNNSLRGCALPMVTFESMRIHGWQGAHLPLEHGRRTRVRVWLSG